VSRILRRVMSAGFRRGLGGSRAWGTLGLMALVLRVAGLVVRKKPETVFRHELRPGDAFEIRAGRPARKR
jgi:hypothetical protein